MKIEITRQRGRIAHYFVYRDGVRVAMIEKPFPSEERPWCVNLLHYRADPLTRWYETFEEAQEWAVYIAKLPQALEPIHLVERTRRLENLLQSILDGDALSSTDRRDAIQRAREVMEVEIVVTRTVPKESA